MSRIIFMDTETSGLPKRWHKQVNRKNFEDYPRLVSLCFKIGIIHEEMRIEEEYYEIIRPDGFVIPDDAIAIHGITNRQAEDEGIPAQLALERVCQELSEADFICGHNVEFDLNVIKAEAIRHQVRLSYDCEIVDTMTCNQKYLLPEFTQIFNIRYRKLEDLHSLLYGSKPNNMHNAQADVNATIRCFEKIYLESLLKN